MKQYDAYLFDWDGTLGRTLELWLDIMHNQLKRYGVTDVSDTDIVKSLGRFKKLGIDFAIPAEKLPALLADVQKEAAERSVDVAMYEGAVDVLERLKNSGARLALITSNWREAVDIMLERHELETLFDVIITNEDVASHKPDPEGIHLALDALKVPAAKAVMIGDSDKDLGAAQNAGIDSILFYPPSHQLFYDLKELNIHKPTYTIDGWDKLTVEAAAN